MGFFQDLKEDLSMAVDELASDGNVEQQTEAAPMTEEDIKQQLEAMSQAELKNAESKAAPAAEPEAEPVVEEAPATEAVDDSDMMPSEELAKALEAAGVVEPVSAPDAISPDGKAAPVFGEQMELNLAQSAAPAKKADDTIEKAANELKSIANIVNKDEVVPDTAPLEDKETAVPEQIISAPAEQILQPSEESGDIPMDESQLTGAPTDENAVVTTCMRVSGDIISRGSVEIQGIVKGNVSVLGKLNVSGQLTGDAKAAEIFADRAQMSGNVTAEGTAKIGKDSVIIGNIYATSAVIAGAVKGDIDVHGPVILDSSAIVMGNIRSKSVQINNGAAIEGMCSQCYADNNPSSFFDKFLK